MPLLLKQRLAFKAMTYSATAFRLLFSMPSDVPEDDLAMAIQTVGRWNAIYGQQFGAVVVPTNWKQHSVARHGVRPQEALNVQLVDEADIVIALFWHRLGSRTGTAESGTAEEIERAHQGNAYVGILRCRRDIPQQELDVSQIRRLERFFSDVRSRSLVLEYQDEADLARHVDAILNSAVSASRARAAAVVEQPPKPADVWPRVETSERVRTDPRGRVVSHREYFLVLSNTGSEAAKNVRHRLEADGPNETVLVELETPGERGLESLAPAGDARFALFVSARTPSQVRCVVQWEDSAGEHENVATLRLF
jgi:hypothetical protein